MRVKISVVDGSRKKGIIDYRRGVARCVKGIILDSEGKEKSFRMYGNRQYPKDWLVADMCTEYNESKKIVSEDIADAIVKAYRMVHGK